MILNIETKNPQQTLKDVCEVYATSIVTIVNSWSSITEYEIKESDTTECVYPLDGLIELKSYGYNIRIR